MVESISREQKSHSPQHQNNLATYCVGNKQYSVTQCRYTDIPVHSERVCHLWTDPVFQTDAMIDAISQNTAWQIPGLCFLYAIAIGKDLCGISFWCKTKLFAALGYRYVRDYTKFRSISWNPHSFHGIPLGFLLSQQMVTAAATGSDFVRIGIPDTKLEQILRHRTWLYNIRQCNGR